MGQSEDSTNSYTFFLGIPQDQPNHYQLLGIERGTQDPKAILEAATNQNRKLLQWQNSDEHHQDAKKLMMEVAQAKLVLTDPITKAAYDRELSQVTTTTNHQDDEIVFIDDEPPLDVTDSMIIDDKPPLDVSVPIFIEDPSNSKPDDPNEHTKGLDRLFLKIAWGLVIIVLLVAIAPQTITRIVQTIPKEVLEGFRVILILAASLSTLSGIFYFASWLERRSRIETTERVEIRKPPLIISPFEAEEATQSQENWATHLNQKVVVSPRSIIMNLVLIPPGNFFMGSDYTSKVLSDENPLHEVTITQPYFLGKLPVTQYQWMTLMGTRPWLKTNLTEELILPATHITWEDATSFCKKLTETDRRNGFLVKGWSYRLPSEAQWEFACRAGSVHSYYYGDNEEYLKTFANYNQKTIGYVGRKVANNFGLNDMLGSVWEWCLDAYREDYYKSSPGADPICVDYLQSKHRVARGGSWKEIAENCTCAKRRHYYYDIKDADLGFRVALVFTG